ncbi:hypothetical protein [Staphylococcus arlettae]|uniref:hypothetical protein n=1 Tax=Staphylococcus arlettae TaxID=29378 RepID=UPI0021CDF83F|nr:hypothetical protein [Staphylococcus arlettae]UXU52645.1 hypothetical protein MUA71_00810 [Staphylococcus arlettae]
MEILLEIYMYIKNEIKKIFLVSKARKKFKELSNIDRNIKKLYEENQNYFEADEKVVAKVMEVDKYSDTSMKELSEFLEYCSEQNK